MMIGYRIVFQTFDINTPTKEIVSNEIIGGEITKPTDCLDFTLDYEDQISLLKGCIDNIVTERINLIHQIKICPKCSGNLIKIGTTTSIFHDVLTDHELQIQRIRCGKCRHELPSSIRSIINSSMSPNLVKIQAELGAQHTFRDAEDILEKFSTKNRKINNRNRIKNITNDVGDTIVEVDLQEKEILTVSEAAELILNVDGGHVKTTEEQRSIEAMTSVIYRPESLKSNNKDTRNYILDKSCAASVKNDKQEELISNTLLCALKQGLTPNTRITALCDGAANCWNVVDSLKPFCKETICILDWFHIGKKIQNIATPNIYKNKLEKVKWHLWRGNVKNAIKRMDELIVIEKQDKFVRSIKLFKKYIENNIDKIVNYRDRQKRELVFTSNLAESTVESLINRRCKGHQHMRWSREGLNPILQLRAKFHSQDWNDKWRTVVVNSMLKTV